MAIDKTVAIQQIDAALTAYLSFCKKHYVGDKFRNAPDFELDFNELIYSMMETIRRLAPPNSSYCIETKDHHKLAGILKSLRSDFDAGYIKTYLELIHGDTFSDFLKMAEHLSAEAYKDAAAVIAGGVLEQHLRELCDKNGIDTIITDSTGKTRPKMINDLNADLYKKGVYAKGFMQQITAWATIRNDAAHADYAKVDAKQVELMIAGLRNLIQNFPA